MKPKVAFIGTGGTISSLGTGPLDILDYGATGNRMQADAILARFPECAEAAEVVAVNFENVPSHNIYFDTWKRLAALCARLVAEAPELAGIVIGHGTASLEETAFFLNLVLDVPVPRGAGRQPAAGERAVDRCWHEPGERGCAPPPARRPVAWACWWC